jgi:hypothetical protein
MRGLGAKSNQFIFPNAKPIIGMGIIKWKSKRGQLIPLDHLYNSFETATR